MWLAIDEVAFVSSKVLPIIVPKIINNPIFCIVSLNPLNNNFRSSTKWISNERPSNIDAVKSTKNGCNFK